MYVSMLSGCLCQVLTLYFNVAFHSAPEPVTEAEKARFGGGGVCRAVDLPFDPLANTFGTVNKRMLPTTSSTRILNPRLPSSMTSYDVASDICQVWCPPRHRHAFRTLVP